MPLGFLGGSVVKNPLAKQETWVWSLGQEDYLEKEMATHSSTLALKIPWTEELAAGYYPWGGKESGTTEQLHFLSLCQNKAKHKGSECRAENRD